MQTGRGKKLTPSGLVWGCLVSGGTEAASCKGMYKTRASRGVTAKAKEETRSSGGRGALSLLPSHCCDCTCCMWPVGTEGSRSHSVVTRQLQPCQLPPSSLWEKGSRNWTSGGETPCRAASYTDPRRSLSRNGHWTVLTWRFPREPREFEDRREKPAESIKGWGVL